jgi:hypothetical protein
MGKSLQELKEMIDSVIVENGKGQITAQSLNLVLNEMSEAFSEIGGSGGGGGAEAYYIYTSENINEETGDMLISEEERNHNAEQYLKIVENYNNNIVSNIFIKWILMDVPFEFHTIAFTITSDPEEPNINYIGCIFNGFQEIMIMIAPDGSVILM